MRPWRKLHLLRATGVRLAIDDFGTGYSSLGYPRQLPVDIIKVDRCFIGPIVDDPQSMAIVKAITTLAHTLGMAVVGEGIETTGQLRALSGLDCDFVQRYLRARPGSATTTEDPFRRGHGAPDHRRTDLPVAWPDRPAVWLVGDDQLPRVADGYRQQQQRPAGCYGRVVLPARPTARWNPPAATVTRPAWYTTARRRSSAPLIPRCRWGWPGRRRRVPGGRSAGRCPGRVREWTPGRRGRRHPRCGRAAS